MRTSFPGLTGESREYSLSHLWIPAFAGMTFVLGLSSSLFAGSGASFLKVPVGARAVGMGNAYTAAANDVTAMHWNPAGLSGADHKELGVMHAELFEDTRFDFMGFAMPVGARDDTSLRLDAGGNIREIVKHRPAPWTLGMSAVYLSQGEIEGRDESRQKTGGFSASDLAVGFGASRKVNARTSLGTNLKLVRQTIASQQANGWMMDLGVVTRLPKMSLALAVLNLGPSLKFASENYSLPLTLSLGTGFQTKAGFSLSFDVKHRPYDQVTNAGVGAELQMISAFALRAGYSSALAGLQKNGGSKTSFLDQFSGVAGGFGVKVLGSQVDYALTPMGEVGAAQRLSITFRF